MKRIVFKPIGLGAAAGGMSRPPPESWQTEADE